MKKLLVAFICVILVACGGVTTPTPVLETPTEIPTLIPTLPPPENTPTLPPTAPPANPIQHLPAGTEVTITTIQMADLNRGWAIGTAATDPNEHILLTADGGAKWKDVTPPEGMDDAGGKVATVYFKGADTAWVIYSSNVLQSPPAEVTIWKTTNAGKDWTASQPILPPGKHGILQPGVLQLPR